MFSLPALLFLAAEPAPIVAECPVLREPVVTRAPAKVQQPVATTSGAKAEPVRTAQDRRPASLRGSSRSTTKSAAKSPATGEASANSPGFVADEIGETFEAIVDGSVKQMEAYGEMVAETSDSVTNIYAKTLRPGNLMSRASLPKALSPAANNQRNRAARPYLPIGAENSSVLRIERMMDALERAPVNSFC